MKEMSPVEEIRHSAAHVLATAVLRLYPDTQLDIGPPTDSGFYYDFDSEVPFTPEILLEIEDEMKKVIKENQRFERLEVSREEAVSMIKEMGQPTYKLGRLDDIPAGETISFYRNGEFLDLCAGSHVSYTKKIKAFKLLNIAGSYHRGDSSQKQLQRIYGTAFASKDELSQYLQRIEEAKLRDHRVVGKDLGLFHIDEQVGQGLVLWKPNGAIIRQELEGFITEQLNLQGYSQVYTPHIGKLDLYRTSGHFPYYQDSQYPPIIHRECLEELAEEGCTCSELSNKLEKGEIDGYLLKPMNCPMHIRIFKSEQHSYRDLPVRLAEFGTVYRWEQSGELNGMTRVRGFTQDDAHLFIREDQLQDEIQGCLSLVKLVFSTLGMNDYRVRVSLRDPESDKYVGAPEAWDKAETALRQAVKTLGVDYEEELGEAAFYGPKIDFVVKDVIGREWQLGTVQVDYNLPDRFDLSYVGKDNQNHRPVMIHRAPFGSMERFCGVLIEHFGGNFPTWLAPEQVRLLPMNDDLIPYAESCLEKLKAKGVRASIDGQSAKLGAKIRKAETDKIPHMLILGKREAEEGKVSLRSRSNPDFDGPLMMDEIVTLITSEISSKSLPKTRTSTN
ncbi:threonine--tRNA ligase [bacterium]|uniref:threonine--tRNA ligase n=1 Tax=Candidatus Chordibacter forsetii TaxID=3381758 RepID=UPI00230E2CB2|nr:threonine--tRNA ligase [bacterium]MDA9119260.1 threonine--tRNA ligase [Opitutales bacterium]MDC3284153.1 threonine--tRNA ligase [Opitutales bacterium]